MTLHQQILPLASSWRGRLLALNGHGAAVAACLLLGQQRTAFARSEYFAF